MRSTSTNMQEWLVLGSTLGLERLRFTVLFSFTLAGTLLPLTFIFHVLPLLREGHCSMQSNGLLL